MSGRLTMPIISIGISASKNLISIIFIIGPGSYILQYGLSFCSLEFRRHCLNIYFSPSVHCMHYVLLIWITHLHHIFLYQSLSIHHHECNSAINLKGITSPFYTHCFHDINLRLALWHSNRCKRLLIGGGEPASYEATAYGHWIPSWFIIMPSNHSNDILQNHVNFHAHACTMYYDIVIVNTPLQVLYGI